VIWEHRDVNHGRSNLHASDHSSLILLMLPHSSDECLLFIGSPVPLHPFPTILASNGDLVES
jgi:hypothetical protein